jgi:hypothetical protein
MPELDVRVCSVRGLKNTQLIGVVDPYCVVTFEKQKQRTHTCHDSTTPVWNHDFTFIVKDEENSSQLHFQVWNENFFSDDLLGECFVSVESLTRGDTVDRDVLLERSKSNAQLHVRLTAVDFGAPRQTAVPDAIDSPASIHPPPLPVREPLPPIGVAPPTPLTPLDVTAPSAPPVVPPPQQAHAPAHHPSTRGGPMMPHVTTAHGPPCGTASLVSTNAAAQKRSATAEAFCGAPVQLRAANNAYAVVRGPSSPQQTGANAADPTALWFEPHGDGGVFAIRTSRRGDYLSATNSSDKNGIATSPSLGDTELWRVTHVGMHQYYLQGLHSDDQYLTCHSGANGCIEMAVPPDALPGKDQCFEICRLQIDVGTNLGQG